MISRSLAHAEHSRQEESDETPQDILGFALYGLERGDGDGETMKLEKRQFAMPMLKMYWQTKSLYLRAIISTHMASRATKNSNKTNTRGGESACRVGDQPKAGSENVR